MSYIISVFYSRSRSETFDIEAFPSISKKKASISAPILEVNPKRPSLQVNIAPNIEGYLLYRIKKSSISGLILRKDPSCHPISTCFVRYQERYQRSKFSLRTSRLFLADIDEIITNIEFADLMYGNRVQYEIPTSGTMSCLPSMFLLPWHVLVPPVSVIKATIPMSLPGAQLVISSLLQWAPAGRSGPSQLP